MSRTIDQRVVDMQFNNKDFESGIKTSIKSIDKLKEGLNFDKSVRSLSELDRAGKKVDLSSIARGVEAISGKFTMMGVVGVTALANLANSAVNAGKRMVDALTIAPIRTGLEEYETKINAIQTILTNTASKGVTLKEVNAVLADLNEYSDKTIYNFAEMTRNIGTFTAAGVGLQDSAIAIKGIANLAAGSGSNAQQAASAMYQLSQALASGSVKLMDWNSVVNAGMGGELFQNALRETAKGMGKVIEKGKPFRETLEKGWLTSDVLIKTLTKFANDPMLVKAATQVKTFSQMIDTMKESVQSGWAVSWENIIGNKDEAAKLFTAINDGFGKIIGRSADARNEMLAFWKANGGRQAIIDGLSAGFENLARVVKYVTNSFKDIFPALTGKDLVEASKQFKELFENFKIGDETSQNLKRTFRGLFAILDIGRLVLVDFGKMFFNLLKELGPIGDGLLSITASIGDSILAFREAYKSGEGLPYLFKKIGEVLTPVAKALKHLVQQFGNTLKALANMDFGSLDTFAKKIQFIFGPFIALGNMLMSFVTRVFPLVAQAFDTIGTIITRFFAQINTELKSLQFETIINVLTGAFFMQILSSVNKFVKSLTEISKGSSSFVSDIKAVLGGVGDILETYQKNLQAKTILSIALAVGVLAASLMALAAIDPGRLTGAVGALSVLFAQMFVATGIFGKLAAAFKSFGAIKVTTMIIPLAISLLILAKALKEMSSLNWEQLMVGITGLSALILQLAGASYLLSKSASKLSLGAVGMVSLAITVKILVSALEEIANIDSASLTKGLIGLGVVLGELALFSHAANKFKIGPLTAAGLVGMAVAINILALAIKQLGGLDVESLRNGVIALGSVLVILAGFLKATPNVAHVISTATGLTILGGAMLLFTKAIADLGYMDLSALVQGLAGMAGALTAVALAMHMMPKHMLVNSAALIGVGAAVNLLAIAIGQLGKLSLESLGKGLLGLGAGLAIVAIAMKAMAFGLPGAAAMLVMATALSLFVPVLGLLSSIPFTGIVVGLIAIAGAFAIIGAATVILGPMIPLMLGLGASMTLLGVGFLAIGTGVSAFSTGLAILINTFGLFVDTVIKSGGKIVKIIPDMISFFSTLLDATSKVFVNAAPAFIRAVVSLIDSVCKALVISIPQILDTFTTIVMKVLAKLVEFLPKFVDMGLQLIVNLLKGVAKKLPDIIDAGTDILIKLLQGVARHIGKIVEAGVDIIVNFIKGIASQISKVVNAAFDIVISFVNGLADAIRKNTPLLIKAVQNLFSAIIEAGWMVLTSAIPGLAVVGKKLMDTGVIQGIQNGIGSFVETIGGILVKGVDILAKGVTSFYDIGKNLVNGFIKGVTDKFTAVAEVATFLGESAISTVKNILGIHSPSRVFEKEIGEMLGLGMAKGIKQKTPEAVQAAQDMSKSIFETAKEWIDEKKYYNQLSLEEELIVWQKTLKHHKVNADERKKIDREVYRVKQEMLKAEEELLKKNFDKTVKYIDDKKYYNQMSLEQEIAAWERIQARYKKGTDEREKADKELYSLKKELLKAEEEIKNKRIQLEKDYQTSAKAINDQLKTDIEDLTQKYKDAIKSRADTLYSTYGLFEKIETPEAISGTELLDNLEGQVKAFADWQKTIDELSAKQVSADLIKELRDMGPKSATEIAALSKLTAPQLERYVALWKQKHEQVNTQATNEMEVMRVNTQQTIATLHQNASVELTKLRATFESEITKLGANTNRTFLNLVDEIKAIDWQMVGVDILNKITSGISAKAATVTNAVKEATKAAVEAAKNAIPEQPVIKPVLDMSDVLDGSGRLNDMLTPNGVLVAAAQAVTPPKTTQSTSNTTPSGVTFVQNNYSPTALSRLDIYRDTQNQLSILKGLMVEA